MRVHRDFPRVAQTVYKPPFDAYNATQDAFMESQTANNLLSGAVRAGKTRPLVERCLADAQRYPGGRFALVRKTRATLEETTIRSFLVDACGCPTADDPLQGYGLIKSWNKAKLKGTLHNGSEILCFGLDRRAGEREPRKIGSLELTKVYIDEATELEESDFNMLWTRLSYQKHGSEPQAFMATNPAGKSHWIYKRFIQNQKENAFVGFVNPFDNPYLPAEYLAELDALPHASNFYRRMVLGEWIDYLGMVFDAFDEEKHVIDSVPPLKGRAFNFRSFDFGGRNPFSACWFRYFPEADILVHYREVYKSAITNAEFGQLVNRHTPEKEEIRYSVADHDTAARLELNQQGIPTILAKKDVKPGIDAVNKRLAENKLFFYRNALVERDPVLGTEDNLFGRICPQSLLEEIPGYEWGVDSKGVPTEEPVKKDDHSADSLRYASMSLESRIDKAAYDERLDW